MLHGGIARYLVYGGGHGTDAGDALVNVLLIHLGVYLAPLSLVHYAVGVVQVLG